MIPKTSQRLDNLPPYAFAALGRRLEAMRAEGKDVIRLDVGSPDMPPPDPVIEKLIESARNPAHHGYSGYRGTPDFREACAEYYSRRFGVELNPDTEVLPCIGSKEGIANIALAFLEPGYVALVPDPAYPTYSRGAYLAGADVYYMPLLAENDFLPDLDAIPEDVLNRARLLWLNYPNNPTGAVADMDFLRKAVAFCREHGLLLCSDNPYADVTYDGYRAHSVLEVEGAKEVAVEFNSLSKLYNMAGWRIGMCVGNPDAVAALFQVKSNVDTGHFRAVLDAAALALRETDAEWIAARNAEYQKRRDLILAALPEIGLDARRPKAALYVWARVVDGDDKEYAERALNEALVSITPGSVYGRAGRGYIRFSLGTATDLVEEAMNRLRRWYK